MQLYKNRHKSPEALLEWQQIEEELGLNKKDFVNETLPLEPLVRAQAQKMEDNLITSCAKVEIGQSEFTNSPTGQLQQNPNLHLLKQRFPRQPSTDEGCYTHSSTYNTSSSGSGSNGSNGAKYKMSAALTHAMVTAAIPVARYIKEILRGTLTIFP